MTHHRPEDDETSERLEPAGPGVPPDPPADPPDPNTELIERDETEDGDPILPWLSAAERAADIAAANRDRPEGTPEGTGERDRPVWRRAGDDRLARPGQSER